jgi:hypothetical protein
MMAQGEGKHSRYTNLLDNVDHFTIMANVSLRCKRYNVLSVSLIALNKNFRYIIFIVKERRQLRTLSINLLLGTQSRLAAWDCYIISVIQSCCFGLFICACEFLLQLVGSRASE